MKITQTELLWKWSVTHEWTAQFHIADNYKIDRTLKLAGTKLWDMFAPWSSVWAWTVNKKWLFWSHFPFSCCHICQFLAIWEVRAKEGYCRELDWNFLTVAIYFIWNFKYSQKQAEKLSKHLRVSKRESHTSWLSMTGLLHSKIIAFFHYRITYLAL